MKKIILVTAICGICTQVHSQWSLTGNNGTNASTNFIGTKDNVAFKMRTNNKVRMTVSSSGQVGIGTTSPKSKLDVAGGITAYSSYFTRNDGAPGVSIGRSGANYGSVGYGLTFTDTTDLYRYNINDFSSMISFRAGGFDFNTAPGGTSGNAITYNRAMSILQNGNVGIGTSTPANKLSVAGNADFTGNVGIGDPNPGGYKLYVVSHAGINSPVVEIENTVGSSGANGLFIKAGSDIATGANFIVFYRPSGAPIGGVQQTTINGVSYLTTSDRRLKNIIGASQKGLSDLMKINIYDYTFKTDPEKKVLTGFMAQELYDVFPQSVSRPAENDEPAEKNPWMVDYGSVTPLIIKSVQEQQKQIENSEARSQKLEEEIEDLKSENEKMKLAIEKLMDGKVNSQVVEPGTAKLEQNIPNPFNEQTVIHFYIPSPAKSAVIKITDAGNKELKSFSLSERGASQINISAGMFAPGVYAYQLMVDGKVVDTKQMVIINK
ncbi:MAG: tail fiber domain-containing protein [Bacteroidia bacterium]